MKLRFLKRPIPFWARLGFVVLLLGYAGGLRSCITGDIFFHTHMPGSSYSGAAEPLTEDERRIRSMLYRDVSALTEQIGERNLWHYANLMKSADYIKRRFKECGYATRSQIYTVRGKQVENIEAERTGQGNEVLVVGAHYDSVRGTTGANDNGTGVAALLTLACELHAHTPARTVRFVAFVNEEPPFFHTSDMGSVVYAKQCKKEKQNIVGMISLETMGFYSGAAESQSYPFPLGFFYPKRGDFISFAGNNPSAALLKNAVISFRRHTRFPSEGGIVPAVIPGVGWSDHWSFWQEDYPAIMITDTALFRYSHYHTPEDTIDKILFDPFAKVVKGLSLVVLDLGG